MDNQSASLKFALIGHQESWEQVMQFIEPMRSPATTNDLTLEKVKEVFTFIPPRKLFSIKVNSTCGKTIEGAYVETFIAPDEMDMTHLGKNIQKVKQACEVCASLNVPVVSLGGFSSIVLETGKASFTNIEDTFFTTGNTLTAAFICKSVEKACDFWQKDLSASRLLIIGSTGDIGSACAMHFSDKVKQLLLCARQESYLRKQANEFTAINVANIASTQLGTLVANADIIISVASSIVNEQDFENISEETIVCDAGYPKNLQALHLKDHQRLFYGGMGVVEGGYEFENNLERVFYRFPIPSLVHGCLLESIVLAMESMNQSYSKGRGNITLSAMTNILSLAEKHGIQPAPLFNKVAINATAEIQ